MTKRLRWLVFFAIGGVAVAMLAWLAPPRLLNQSGNTAVWRFASGKWDRTPRLEGAAVDIQAGRDGSVWVATVFHAGLNRWDRDHWTWFKSQDFGTQTNYASGGFAVAGDQVWAATDEAVLHWDGARWRELPIHGEPDGIAAAGEEAWTITSTGTLTHYTPAGESAADLRAAIPRANWVKRVAMKPVLGRTSDGTIWLEWEGIVRRQSDSGWKDAGLRYDTKLLRTEGDLIWFWTGKSLVAMNGQGTQVRSYALGEWGVRDVAAAGDRVWIADEHGIRQVAGGDAGVTPLPPNALGVTRMAWSSDGVLWAVAVMPHAAGNLVMIGLAILMILFLSVSLWVMRVVFTSPVRTVAENRGWRAELPALRKILLGVAAMAAVLLALVMLVQRVVTSAPAASAWTSWFWILLAPVAVAWIAMRVRRKKETIARATISTLGWLAFILLLESGMDPFFKLFRTAGQGVLALFGLVLLFCFGYAFGEDLPLKGPYDRLRRGDYEGALARANRLLPWWPDKATLRYIRGTTMLFAGRSQEAESDLRASIPLTKQARKKAIARSNLGYALLDQERYGEAAECFEESIGTDPGSGSASNGLAEVLLRQDQQPFEALRSVDRAIELKQRSGVMDRHMLAYMWANRARALAKLGRDDEALAAVRNADNECAAAPDFVPGLAGAHWRIGLALQALGRTAEAREHFRRAREKDPSGNYGTRAANALHDLGG
ncbi:MAG TPA: tetratricopeptide repeat protein [Bryobacteraceae bacterium]|nr:tetratricopeptide repeat protein [Bryobacteraceae bacterium]